MQRTKGRAGLASLGRPRFLASRRTVGEPLAADRQHVLPPSTRCHASAGPTGGASSRWHRASPRAGGTASRTRRRRFAARGRPGGTVRRRRSVARVGHGTILMRDLTTISLPRVALRSRAVEPTAAGRRRASAFSALAGLRRVHCPAHRRALSPSRLSGPLLCVHETESTASTTTNRREETPCVF